MCLPGGPTTISLLLASLSKRLSARWWAPVQRMNHQWRYFSLGRCSSEALCIPKGASLSRIWKRCSVCLQSDSSLSGFLLEFNTQKAVGVVVGFICSEHTPGVCLYGFAQLKPVMSWEIWLFHSSLRKHRNKFQLPFGNDCSELGSTHHTDNRRERQSASWWYNYVLFIFWPDTSHISSESPLQLLHFRHKDKRCPSTLTLLPTVDEICQTLPVVDSKQKMDQSAYTHQQYFWFDLQLPYLYLASTSSEEDVRYDVNTLHRQLYPELFEKSMCKAFFFFLNCFSCVSYVHGVFTSIFLFQWPLPVKSCIVVTNRSALSRWECTLYSKAKLCSAWENSYYWTFDGRDFTLQGNCNYTLVQTTCEGVNTYIPLQINVVRIYLNSATLFMLFR